MRINKLNNNNSFAKVFNHNHRAYENSDGVDKTKEHLNIVEGNITSYKAIKEILELRNKRVQEITGRAVRKDAVRGFELLFASDIEFMSDSYNCDEYFKNSIEWCKDIFGEQNFLNAILHKDECGGFHIHATVLSVDETGRYNAKKWVNNRNSLIELQDSWHSKNKYLGLERGKSAKETHNYHLTKQEYSKLLQKDLETVRGLSELDKDLLAVKGLRVEAKENKTYKELKEKQALSKIINDKVLDELLDELGV